MVSSGGGWCWKVREGPRKRLYWSWRERGRALAHWLGLMGRRRKAFHTEETTTECSLGIRNVVGDVRRFETRAEARTQNPCKQYIGVWTLFPREWYSHRTEQRSLLPSRCATNLCWLTQDWLRHCSMVSECPESRTWACVCMCVWGTTGDVKFRSLELPPVHWTQLCPRAAVPPYLQASDSQQPLLHALAHL